MTSSSEVGVDGEGVGLAVYVLHVRIYDFHVGTSQANLTYYKIMRMSSEMMTCRYK